METALNRGTKTGGKKKKSKWLWIGAGILLVLAAVIFFYFYQGVQAETITVQKQDVTATVLEKGKVMSKESRDIFSETQGKVQEVRVDTGDEVKKGDILAVVDVSDLVSQISRLDGELKAIAGSDQIAASQTDSTQLKSQQLALDQARLELDQARTAYERTQRLYEAGAAAKVELDQNQLQMEAAEKAVTYAEAALTSLAKQSGGYEIQYAGQRESLQAQLDYLKNQRDKGTITAEMDGVVFSKSIKEGDMVNPGIPLFTIGKTGDFEIRTYITNKDLAHVKVGDAVKVIFKVPGEDVEIPGMIRKIAPAAEEIVSSLGLTEEKIRLTVDLQKQPETIGVVPGMSVDVEITTQETPNVPAVPKEAVFSDRGEDFVWTVQKGKAAVVRVTIGKEGDDLTEITGGLQEGDTVLLNPHLAGLKPGVRIKTTDAGIAP